ncbi:penicillin acylase family protein [Gaopeijia maritima]|uniref:penicillin acylase family protein n=1 Tax=Gaopeijia maritima TaxID=3119007 RepID=UPI00326A0ECE
MLRATIDRVVMVACTGLSLLLAGCDRGGREEEADLGPPRAVIHRDAWGVPHVLADTDVDVMYGMAWALADDDWPLIEENYLSALGRSAELNGEVALPRDWMARALDIVRLSEAEYAAAPPRLRGMLDGFAEGMNGWLASRPDSTLRLLRRIEPWYPLALIRYKYYQNEFLGYAGLRGDDSDRLLAEGLGGEAAVTSIGAVRTALAPAPRWVGDQFGPLGFRPQGSNQWAVAPSRTADGHALLLINPHQRFVGVQRYAEIHLDSREGLRFSGLTVFGFLLPYMGHNDRLGWAYTDNYADHSDLWGLVLEGTEAPLEYRWDDQRRPLESRTDTILVRTPAGLQPHAARYWRSHHGPVVGLDAEGRPLAVRLARMEEGGWFEQWDAMIRARTLDEWRSAMAMLRVAYMNTMYADADGNIGYIYGSAVPRRLPEVTPAALLDGSDPDTEWLGFHPLDSLPQVWNPESGWLSNTNSTPFTATVGLDQGRLDFPHYMVGEEAHNPRSVSSHRILESLDSIGFDDFASVVWDSRLSAADDAIPAMAQAWDRGAARSSTNAALGPAVDRLERWDRRADTLSVETTWFVLAAELRAAVGAAPLDGAAAGASWLAALDRALTMLEHEWGTPEIAWGVINRHQRPLPGAAVALDPERESLAIGGAPGGLGSVFSYGAGPARQAAPRLGTGGNSFVKIVQFGPTPRAASVLNYGQSGDPASPHFFDQALLYAARSFKPAWWDRAEVEANSVERVEVR